MALHIPWDRVDDFDKLRRHVQDLGVRLGTINTDTFQDNDYMLGSLCHVDDRIRAKAIRHALDCVDVMDVTGSRDLKVWLPDGLNYPGQGDLCDRQERLHDSRRSTRGSEPVSGWCSSTSSSSRLSTRPTCPIGAPRTCTAPRWRTGGRVPRHGASRAEHEHRVHRHAVAEARPVGSLRLQLAFLR